MAWPTHFSRQEPRERLHLRHLRHAAIMNRPSSRSGAPGGFARSLRPVRLSEPVSRTDQSGSGARARGQSSEVLGRGISTTPSEARCGVCHCTSSSRLGVAGRGAAARPVPPAPPSRRPDRCRGGGTSTRRRTGRRAHPVQPTGQLPVRRSRPPPSGPPRVGAARGRPAGCPWSIQPCGRRRSAHPSQHRLEGVSTRIS